MQPENLLRTQITFTEWCDGYLHGNDEHGTTHRATLPDSPCYRQLRGLLREGCRLNLLSCRQDEEGVLHPRDIILEPDYLLDISSLARCVQPYGAPAIGYILNLFEQNEESAARLLGEAANMFLDDCINESTEQPASYRRSTAKFFREYPLQLSTCKDIDSSFFEQLKKQFDNIQIRMGNIGLSSEKDLHRDNIQLEPSFFCEALGLQGRIDLLQSDYSLLIELKSGKADEFRGGAKEEHNLQMLLYKEMLCYNLLIPRNNIRAYLFYSRYPRFLNESSGASSISNALMLRNRIVALLLQMGIDGLRRTIESLTPDDLNEKGDTSRLWNNYLRPRIENIITPIKEASSILRDYFWGNIAFVAREMLIAKAGCNTLQESTERSDNRRNCFADVWRAPLETKLNDGNILTNLEIINFVEDEGICDIIFGIPEYNEGFYPNFRAGDTVFFYRRDTDNDTAVNRQVTRGTLGNISSDRLTVHLRHKQRNRIIYPMTSKYALEHDHMDSTFRATFRDLYSLLSAPKQRIALLLSQRVPEFDKTLTLNADYGNEYINDIVLKAKQAKDIFMLVGPPGTGKTSQALSCMVREFHNDKGGNILLAAYTNRAVDEICQTLEKLPEQPSYIRIGSELNCLPLYSHRLLKNVIAGCNKRDEIRKTLNDTRIIVGTIASLTSRKELFRLKKFHTAIIDEASQILESQMAGLLAATSPDGGCAIEKFILIGDPKQLPAVVTQSPSLSAAKQASLLDIGITDYGVSLFERLYQWYHKHPVEGVTATLYKQGRMHPDVGIFANKYFYNNVLQSIPLPHQTEELPFSHYDENDKYQTVIATRRTAFIETEKEQKIEKQKINRDEARQIAQFVRAYCALHSANGSICHPSKDIGIIVPFRNQIAMVAREISRLNLPDTKDIIIDTVERFQGSQRELILFGTTISHPDEIGMLSSPATDTNGCEIDRKLNVAVTRARRQLFIFGNKEALSASYLYRKLMEEL